MDVNSSVERIREPLQELRATLLAKKDVVDSELASLNDGLRQRSEVGKAKAILELVQDTTNVVSKVEKLLGEMILETSESGSETENQNGKKAEALSDEDLDARSQQLERISTEYSRLKYYLSKGKGLSFLSSLDEQLKLLDTKFFSLLDACASMAFSRRHMPVIQRCINAYNSVGSAKAAEQAFQHAVIRPIVSEVLLTSQSQTSIGEDYDKMLAEVDKQAGKIIESINGQLSGYNSCNIAVAIVAEADMAVSSSRPNIYSPGIPDAFRENYLASIQFLKKVAVYCPQTLQKEFQDSEAVQTFLKRWNLTVYHSLRFQDIAGTFEKHIAGREAALNEKGNPFHLSAANILFECLYKCFAKEVFLPSLANKFCRLSYQLVSRFHVWVKDGLSKRRDVAKRDGSQAVKDFWVNLSTDELVLLVNDLKLFSSKVSVDLKQRVTDALQDLDSKLVEMAFGLIEEMGKEIHGLSSMIKDILGGDVLKQSVDLLKHVRGITATYRMTNRPMPSRPSHYVSSILRPLSELKQSFSKTNVSQELVKELLDYVAKEVSVKYDETAEDLLRTVHQTESSLKRLKERQVQATGSSQGTGAAASDASDADKIRLQLFLDVQEYGKQLAKLGMDVSKESTPEYHKLWQTVSPDGQKEIKLEG